MVLGIEGAAVNKMNSYPHGGRFPSVTVERHYEENVVKCSEEKLESEREVRDRMLL